MILFPLLGEDVHKVVRDNKIVTLLARCLLLVKKVNELLLSQLFIPGSFGFGHQLKVQLLI